VIVLSFPIVAAKPPTTRHATATGDGEGLARFAHRRARICASSGSEVTIA